MRPFLLAGMACLLPALAAAQDRLPAIPPSSMDQIPLKLQGERMQDAVNEVYYQMKSSSSLRPGPNNITIVIRKYIDNSMVIENAVSIMRSAGYAVDPLPPRPEPTNPPPWYHEDDRFKIFAMRTIEKGPGFRAVSIISIAPFKHDLSDSVVNEVEAYISFSGL